MTLEAIEARESEILLCKDVAPLLQCDPAVIHGQAVHEPEKLGFPVIVAKSRVKIPKRAFVRFMKGELVSSDG